MKPKELELRLKAKVLNALDKLPSEKRDMLRDKGCGIISNDVVLRGFLSPGVYEQVYDKGFVTSTVLAQIGLAQRALAAIPNSKLNIYCAKPQTWDLSHDVVSALPHTKAAEMAKNTERRIAFQIIKPIGNGEEESGHITTIVNMEGSIVYVDPAKERWVQKVTPSKCARILRTGQRHGIVLEWA